MTTTRTIKAKLAERTRVYNTLAILGSHLTAGQFKSLTAKLDRLNAELIAAGAIGQDK